MKSLHTKNACLFVVSRHNGSDIFCNKLQAEESVYCPKHVLMTIEHENDYKRRAEKSAITKAKKKLLRESLAESPLKAFNPDFIESKGSAYSR